MNLLFDLIATQPNASGKRHGGGRYAEIILKRMVERNITFSCYYDSKKWLNPEIEIMCREKNIKLFDIQKNTLKEIVNKNKINRIYSALPVNIADINYCEVYGTIHGLRGFETPFDKFFYYYEHSFKDLLRYLRDQIKYQYLTKKTKDKFRQKYLNNNLHFITVSEHSKYAILSYFPEMKDKNIPVFYSPNTSIGTSNKINQINSQKYFLLVSGNRWEKNNLRAIIAFDRLISNGLIKNMRMKITGAFENNYKYKIKNPDFFDFLGYVDDEKLESLYANAYVFVYPSLNEGFGYPPIEAMKYHIPVIASPYSSIAEICNSGALFFNPYSIEEIMNRMMMIQDNKIYKSYSKSGYNQYLRIKERQDKDLDLLIDYIIRYPTSKDL